MGDLERLSGRAGAQQAGARDLLAIAEGIHRLPLLAKNLGHRSRKRRATLTFGV